MDLLEKRTTFLVTALAKIMKIDPAEFYSSSNKKHRLAKGRWVIYTLLRNAGYTYAEIAEVVNRTTGAVYYLLRKPRPTGNAWTEVINRMAQYEEKWEKKYL